MLLRFLAGRPSPLLRYLVSRRFLLGRFVPFLFGVILAFIASSQINSDSISPVKPQTDYLEEICAQDSPLRRDAKILFVGSSLSRTNIDLQELKRYLSEHGYPHVAPLSFGVLGFNLQGGNAMVDRILEIKDIEESLSLIVVDESFSPSPGVWRGEEGTLPYQWLWIGDPAQIPVTVRMILRSSKGMRSSVGPLCNIAYHIGKGCFYSTIGAISRAMAGRSLFREDPNNLFTPKGDIAESLGYVALQEQDEKFKARGPGDWERRVRRFPRSRSFDHAEIYDEIYGWPFQRVMLRNDLSRVGVISMLSPTLLLDADTDHLRRLIRNYGESRFDLWDFGSPEEFPELWTRFENRHDISHLNEAGAIALTRIIGEKIVHFYEANPGVYNGNNGALSKKGP